MIEERATETVIESVGDEAVAGQSVPAETALPDLGVILDIPVVMSLEVGSTELTVSELLSMGTGAVVELNRHTGDPLDVKVNGKLIGRGEVVETNGRYGIRMTEVVSQNERLGRLA